MDPFSITGASIGLIAAIAQLSLQAAQFVSGVREARRDVDSVARELTSLSSCLELLRDDSEKITYPDALKLNLLSVLKNCDAVVTDMDVLLKKYSSTNVGRKVQWAASGREEMNKLRSSLEAHSSALQIALDVTTMLMVTAVKDDTDHIRVTTDEIKDDTRHILSIQDGTSTLIQEIAFLRLQIDELRHDNRGGELLRRFLDESTTYAESVVDTQSLDDYRAEADNLKSVPEEQHVKDAQVAVPQTAANNPRPIDSPIPGPLRPITPQSDRDDLFSYKFPDEPKAHAETTEENQFQHVYQEEPDLRDPIPKNQDVQTTKAVEPDSLVTNREPAQSPRPEPKIVRSYSQQRAASPITARYEVPLDTKTEAIPSRPKPDLTYLPKRNSAFASKQDLGSWWKKFRRNKSASQLEMDQPLIKPVPIVPVVSLTPPQLPPLSQSSSSPPLQRLLPEIRVSKAPVVRKKVPDDEAIKGAMGRRSRLSVQERTALDDRLDKLIRGTANPAVVRIREGVAQYQYSVTAGGYLEIREVLNSGAAIKVHDEFTMENTLCNELWNEQRADVISLLLLYGAPPPKWSLVSDVVTDAHILSVLVDFGLDPNTVDYRAIS